MTELTPESRRLEEEDRPLSPATQAVLDAAYRRMDENPFNEVEATLAATLRAAVEATSKQKTMRTLGVTMLKGQTYCLASDLLSIADEIDKRS